LQDQYRDREPRRRKHLQLHHASAESRATYKTHGGIEVNVTPVDKGPLQYCERREYVSEDEDSRYEITLRYNRVA